MEKEAMSIKESMKGNMGSFLGKKKLGGWCNYILKRLIHQPRKVPAFALVYKSVYRFLFTCDRVVNSFVVW